MADEKKLRSGADRDADAALEEILREVESSPRRTTRRRDIDDLDFVKTGTPRSHAAPPKAETREPSAPEKAAPETAAPAKRSAEQDAAPVRRTREQDAAPVRRPRDPDAESVRRPREQDVQRRRPEGQRANGQQHRPVRDVERAGAPGRDAQQRRTPQHPDAQRRERPQNAQRSRQPQQFDGQRRPQRPADQRPQERVMQERRAPRQRDAVRPQKRSAAAAKRRPNYFRIGLAIYILLGLILTLWGMRRLHNFLKEYEDSRPKYTIDGYVTHLNNGFYSDMIRQKVNDIHVTEYETSDTIASTLEIDTLSNTGYTWAKKVDEYTDDTPVYYIRHDGKSIARVELQRVGGTEKFDFPVWKAKEPESLIEIPIQAEYTLDATVPNGGSLMVNGIKVPMPSLTDTEYEMGLDEVAQTVTANPLGQHVKIDGLFVQPAVRAFDKDGNELQAKEVPDKSVKDQVYVFEPAAKEEPNPVIVARMEELTKAYINYMINKDEATWANRQYLDNFVLNGSDAFNVLHGITQDVAWNNPYTARQDKVLEISNVKMYSDTICTGDAHFELQLTKDSDNGSLTNDYNGTVRWVMVKNGNLWYATHFDLLNGQDTAEAPADEVPAEE